MRIFGLIGYPLSHSFSQEYFSEKFEKEKIPATEYRLFSLEQIEDFPALLDTYPDIKGLNVTLPYKEKIIEFLDDLDETAEKVGAVNVIKIEADGRKIGFNSDYTGFQQSLMSIPLQVLGSNALILGSGGASKAAQAVFKHMNINFKVVSRINSTNLLEHDYLTYRDLDANLLSVHHFIINATPIGMYPNTKEYPDLPYHLLLREHYLYDLVYNPEETAFMQKGREYGLQVKNGLEMLYAQAEKSWEIWNTEE